MQERMKEGGEGRGGEGGEGRVEEGRVRMHGLDEKGGKETH